MIAIARFASIFFAALVAGGMFVIWVGYDPAALSPSTYVEQQQNTIRALNVLMPVLGGLAILLTLTSAVLQRKDRKAFVLLIVAAAFLMVSGLVTRFGNQPINREVMTWSTQSPPSNWHEARDAWWRWHIVRTSAGLLGLGLLICGTILDVEREAGWTQEPGSQ